MRQFFASVLLLCCAVPASAQINIKSPIPWGDPIVATIDISTNEQWSKYKLDVAVSWHADEDCKLLPLQNGNVLTAHIWSKTGGDHWVEAELTVIKVEPDSGKYVGFETKELPRVTFTITQAPRPPPPKPPNPDEPDVDPPPGPTPPTPSPVTTFVVLLVHESGQTLSSGQQAAMDAQAVRQLLNKKCTISKGPVPGIGQPDWRKVDNGPNQTLDLDSAVLKQLWNAVKGNIAPPCVVIQRNSEVHTNIALPSSPDEMVSLINRVYDTGKVE